MGYIAEIQLSHGDLLLHPTIVRADGVTFRRKYANTSPDGRELLFVSAFGGLPEDLVSLLAEDRTVAEPAAVVSFGDRSIYRMRVTTDLDPMVDAYADLDGYVLDVTSDRRGWTVRASLPDRQRLSRIRAFWEDRGVSFHIGRLYDAESVERVGNAGLTEKQRDLLLTALYSGYYDIPRGASQDDLARQVEVSASAISKRLRRATAQLIVSALDPEDVGNEPEGRVGQRGSR